MPRKIVIIYELSIDNAGQGSTLRASRKRRHACLEQRFSPPDAQIVRPGPLLEACRLAPAARHGRVRSCQTSGQDARPSALSKAEGRPGRRCRPTRAHAAELHGGRRCCGRSSPRQLGPCPRRFLRVPATLATTVHESGQPLNSFWRFQNSDLFMTLIPFLYSNFCVNMVLVHNCHTFESFLRELIHFTR
jgi:hypothetical protein